MVFILTLLYVVEKQHSFYLLKCESKRPVSAQMKWHFQGVCPCWERGISRWCALRFQKLKPVHILLPVQREITSWATSPALCLPSCYHASCHEKNELNFGIVSKSKLNIFLYKSCCALGLCSQQKKTLNKTYFTILLRYTSIHTIQFEYLF